MLSKRSKFASNPIEEEDKLVAALQKKGRKIIRLNRGDPTKYFPTPKYIIDAYISALREGKTAYTGSDGIPELREAVSKRYKRMYHLNSNPDNIIVTAGVSEALSFINSALVDQAESAILFKPYYPLYSSLLKLNGGVPTLENYDENNGWNVHTENLAKLLKTAKSSGKLKRIKYLMITNPNNPTGTVLNKKVIEQVVDLASEYNLLLISDEIYDEIIFNKTKFTSVSQLAKGLPYVILNGASKVYDSTGFRIGFVIVPENDKKSSEFKEKIYDYAMMRLSVNAPAQYAAAEAINNVLKHKRALDSMVGEIEKRVNYSTKVLNENPYFETVRPNGAFYILPRIHLEELKIKNDKQFTDLLLEKEGIQVTRGSGFGAPSHFRIVALPPKEILDYSINRINAFCKKYSK